MDIYINLIPDLRNIVNEYLSQYDILNYGICSIKNVRIAYKNYGDYSYYKLYKNCGDIYNIFSNIIINSIDTRIYCFCLGNAKYKFYDDFKKKYSGMCKEFNYGNMSCECGLIKDVLCIKHDNLIYNDKYDIVKRISLEELVKYVEMYNKRHNVKNKMAIPF